MATITETGTIDLKAQKEAHDEASQVATNYITPDGTSTAAFHPEASSTNQVKVDGTGVDIIKGNTSIAKYGDIARIGKSSESRVEIDYHSLKLIDKDGNVYLHISDLRDTNGSATISETFVVDADTEIISNNTTRFRLSYTVKTPIDDNIVSVTVDDVALNANEYVVSTSRYLSIYSILDFGQIVQIEYVTEAAIRAFSFGQRVLNSNIGAESFTTGFDNIASGSQSYAEGYNTTASGDQSHAEGSDTTASGNQSHAEGRFTKASARATHAEGYNTKATGLGSHAEGSDTKAYGSNSHAEGSLALASGSRSHAEGSDTTASGTQSHAEGYKTEASHDSSHAQNKGTIASAEAQTAIGKYNIKHTNDNIAFIIGNGTDLNARSDAFTVDWDGNTNAMGLLKLRTPLINRDGTAPSSTVYDNLHCVEFTDADNENIGRVRMHQDNSGRVGITMQCRNEKTDGTEVINEISASVAKDGTKSYGLSDPAAFCSAISALPRSGGIVTGPVYVKNTVIDRAVNPSSVQYSTDIGGDSSFRLVDKNNAMLAYLRISKQTDGRTGLDIRVWNSDTNGNNAVSGNFHILINRSGTVTYSMTNPENFRNAIGASSGIFPRSVGGTGMSARTTGTVTRSGLTTDGTINVYSNGVTCTLAASNVKLKAALATSSTVQLATLPTGYRPPMNVFTNISSPAQSSNGGAWVRVDSSGVVTLGNYSGAQFTTSTQLYFTITWAL